MIISKSIFTAKEMINKIKNKKKTRANWEKILTNENQVVVNILNL